VKQVYHYIDSSHGYRIPRNADPWDRENGLNRDSSTFALTSMSISTLLVTEVSP
jgi:hypothetical protein